MNKVVKKYYYTLLGYDVVTNNFVIFKFDNKNLLLKQLDILFKIEDETKISSLIDFTDGDEQETLLFSLRKMKIINTFNNQEMITKLLVPLKGKDGNYIKVKKEKVLKKLKEVLKLDEGTSVYEFYDRISSSKVLMNLDKYKKYNQNEILQVIQEWKSDVLKEKNEEKRNKFG